MTREAPAGRYDLLGYVVMPSHCHWVFQPLEEWVATLPEEADASETKRRRTPREQIVHSIDRHTAYECNRILRRAGAFWQKEPYDHWIRSPEQLERILLYIDGNPVKAGYLTAPQEWQFSSAYDRRLLGLELGEPLLKIMAR